MTTALVDYDPSRVIAVWGATELQGFIDGEAIRLARLKETWQLIKGGDGESCRQRTNDFAGRVDFDIERSSRTNSLLTAQFAADELTGLAVLPFLLNDFSGTTLWSSPSAFLVGWPEDVYGTNRGTRRWSLICDPLIPLLGGGLAL